MVRQIPWITAFALALFTAACGGAAPKGTSTSPAWHVTGDLSEACSCSVPCACNFGQGPSPNHFCWALFSLGIQEGSCGDVKLDGLHLAGANGPKGAAIYID